MHCEEHSQPSESSCIKYASFKELLVSIITSAHRMSGTEHDGGNCKFNEEGELGQNPYSLRTLGAMQPASNNTHVSLLKYNERTDRPVRKTVQSYTDVLTFRSPGCVRKFQLYGSISPFFWLQTFWVREQAMESVTQHSALLTPKP
jgi:hypothetical protein